MNNENKLKKELEETMENLSKLPTEDWTSEHTLAEPTFIISYRGELQGMRIDATIGGPSIHLDTEKGVLVGHWAGEHRTTVPVSLNMCDEINEYYERFLPLDPPYQL